MDIVARFEHVSKRYGRQHALDDVSFDIPSGVVFALLGENGAGKTTALRIMLGLADANGGRSQVLGLDSARQGLEIRRRIGYVPEHPVLYPWMTVAEIGWFAAGFYGGKYLDNYRAQAEAFGLSSRTKISALSKGMRAKVVLSLALANDPSLLVLDEPTSGLDPLVRREFLESMVDRAARGQSVLLSSHQLSEVERVADWVAILHRGRIRLVVPLDQLKQTVREVTVTVADDTVTLPELPGEVLRKRKRSRQWQLLLKDTAESSLAAIQQSSNVTDVEFRTPSLEEIFIAYVGDEDLLSAPQDAAPEVVS